MQKEVQVKSPSEESQSESTTPAAKSENVEESENTVDGNKNSTNISENQNPPTTEARADQEANDQGTPIMKCSVARAQVLTLTTALSTYTIHNWPAPTPAVRSALDAIALTHDLNIPPFYDQHGMLISPNEGYRTRLAGAVVQVRFTLTQYTIGGRLTTRHPVRRVFCSDVAEVHVVFPPPPRVVTPRKRRIFAVHPSSPSKKRKISES
jgi:hypothetical protein